MCNMADVRLKLRDLLNGLSSRGAVYLTNAQIRRLVVELRVTPGRISDINDQYGDPLDRKTHYLQAWLDIEPDATWSKVSDALRNNMDMTAQADQLDEAVRPAAGQRRVQPEVNQQQAVQEQQQAPPQPVAQEQADDDEDMEEDFDFAQTL